MAENQQFDRFGELLAVELAGGSSVRDAAAKVGCSETQAYRLARSPEVTKRVNEIRKEASQEVVGQISRGSVLAVETLMRLMGEDYEPSVQLNAAKALLSQSIPLTEMGDFRERLEKLEGAA